HSRGGAARNSRGNATARDLAALAAARSGDRRPGDRRGRRGVRRADRLRRRAHRQPRVPGALRHDARVSAGDEVERVSLVRDRAAARRGGRHRRVVDAAPPQHSVAGGPMTSAWLAWRTTTRYRARTILATIGVAVIGALLFDMLLLSRGLVISFADLLEHT